MWYRPGIQFKALHDQRQTHELFILRLFALLYFICCGSLNEKEKKKEGGAGGGAVVAGDGFTPDLRNRERDDESKIRMEGSWVRITPLIVFLFLSLDAIVYPPSLSIMLQDSL